jgi:hypothetical protein
VDDLLGAMRWSCGGRRKAAVRGPLAEGADKGRDARKHRAEESGGERFVVSTSEKA